MVNIDKIKSLAKQKGISISFLCSKIGMGRGYFNDVKNGKTIMNDSRVLIIADALDTTVEYLTDQTDDANKPENGRVDEIHEIINQLSADNRAKLLELSRLFLDAQNKTEENK